MTALIPQADDPPTNDEVSEEDMDALQEILAAVVKLQNALIAGRTKPLNPNQQRSVVRDYLSDIGRFLDDLGHSDDRGVLIQLISGLDDLDSGATPRLFKPASHKKPPASNSALFERAIIAAALEVSYRSGRHGTLHRAADYVARKVRWWPEARLTKEPIPEAIKTWRTALKRKGWEKAPLAREVYDCLSRVGRFDTPEAVLREGARMLGIPTSKV